MTTMSAFRVGAGLAGILAATLGLTGCIGGPTYGTNKTAMEHLTDDLGSTLSIGSKEEERRRRLKYNPRPQLVVAKGDAAQLPPPQQSLAGRENNPGWVESPEETRERLRQEADANESNPNYRSPLAAGRGKAGQLTETEKWEAFRRAKQEVSTADVTARRRSLTDPPTTYRAVDPTALNDLGEPELQKEKRRKKEAADARNSNEWWKLF